MSDLMKAIAQAAIAVAERDPALRGHWNFDEAELQELAERARVFLGRPSSPVSEGEVEAAAWAMWQLGEPRIDWDEVVRLSGEGLHIYQSMASSFRNSARAALQAASKARGTEVEVPELANEIWELLFNITKDAVPEELTDDVLTEIAKGLLVGYSIQRRPA